MITLYICYMDIFLCFYKCTSIFESNKLMPVLRFSQRCCCVVGCKVVDVSTDRVTCHPQSQAVVCDCCKLSGTSRDFETSGKFYPKTAIRRHIPRKLHSSIRQAVNLSYDIKYFES